MNARAMLLSLVTGLGHVYLRHYVLGAVLFGLFAVCLNGVFLGWVIVSNEERARLLAGVSAPLAIAVWLFGLYHAYRISYGTDRTRLREERSRLFREGLVAYLRDDLEPAARALESAVERDVDWEDPDALFHLGVVELRRSEAASARGERRSAQRAKRRGLRAFKTCLARDDRKKWRGEIANERERAKQPPRTPTRISLPVASLESSDEARLPGIGAPAGASEAASPLLAGPVGSGRAEVASAVLSLAVSSKSARHAVVRGAAPEPAAPGSAPETEGRADTLRSPKESPS